MATLCPILAHASELNASNPYSSPTELSTGTVSMETAMAKTLASSQSQPSQTVQVKRKRTKILSVLFLVHACPPAPPPRTPTSTYSVSLQRVGVGHFVEEEKGECVIGRLATPVAKPWWSELMVWLAVMFPDTAVAGGDDGVASDGGAGQWLPGPQHSHLQRWRLLLHQSIRLDRL